MRRLGSVVMILIMTAYLTAYGWGYAPWGAAAEAGDAPAHEAADTVSRYPITVIDQAGRRVVIEREPRRIISGYYIATSLLMALDVDDRLVGVEDNAGLRPIYELGNSELLELPGIGTAKTLDMEACAALSPDLAILPMKVRDAADILEALGITVLLVKPESQELLTEMIRLVAAATDTEERAGDLIGFLAEQEERLEQLLSGTDKPAVYLAGNSSFLTTAGNGMYQSDMIRLAGGRNVAEDIENTYWAPIDYEQLLVWDPEYMILPSSAKYTAADVMADPNLSACRAVKNGHVCQIPGNVEAWDSPVPGSILGAMWLASVLHPDLMTDADYSSVMDEYYEAFYGFTCSKD